MVTFWAPGVPVPQGSMKSFRHASTGRIITTSDNPKLKGWRTTLVETAQAHVGALGPIEGPVAMQVSFFFPRPASHYGKRGLRAAAPAWLTSSKNDLDKLVRATCDALTNAGVWRDDGQVVSLWAEKSFCTEAAPNPGVRIRLCEQGSGSASLGALVY